MAKDIRSLDEAVSRLTFEEKADAAIHGARFRFILAANAKSVFFAVLTLRLRLEPLWEIPTMGVDGKTLFYNPEFVCSLQPLELQGVLAHEVMHCALAHPFRLGNREPRRWNIAADLTINPLLVEAGLTLPAGRLMPGENEFSYLSPGHGAEEYYALIKESSGEGEDPGGCGSVIPPGDGSQATCEEMSSDWEIALAQAVQEAQRKGSLPAGLSRLVTQVLQPKVNWRDVLREFVRSQSRNDYNFSPPNRRFVHMGIYLPGLRSEELGQVLLAVDTSGSIGEQQLSLFASEAQAALEAYHCTAKIVYHDAVIQHTQEWSPSDGPLVLEPRGGGGTSHVCVFQYAAEMPDPPVCVLCLTDCYTEYPSQGPDMPTLWCVINNPDARVPFGRTLNID